MNGSHRDPKYFATELATSTCSRLAASIHCSPPLSGTHSPSWSRILTFFKVTLNCRLLETKQKSSRCKGMLLQWKGRSGWSIEDVFPAGPACPLQNGTERTALEGCHLWVQLQWLGGDSKGEWKQEEASFATLMQKARYTHQLLNPEISLIFSSGLRLQCLCSVWAGWLQAWSSRGPF